MADDKIISPTLEFGALGWLWLDEISSNALNFHEIDFTTGGDLEKSDFQKVEC